MNTQDTKLDDLPSQANSTHTGCLMQLDQIALINNNELLLVTGVHEASCLGGELSHILEKALAETSDQMILLPRFNQLEGSLLSDSLNPSQETIFSFYPSYFYFWV